MMVTVSASSLMLYSQSPSLSANAAAANRRVRLFGDSLLLMRLYLRHFAEAGTGEKKAMLPRLVKKTLALAYYKLFNK